MLLFSVLMACGSPTPVETTPASPPITHDTAAGDDTGAIEDSTPPEVTEESVGDQDADGLEDWIFDDTYIHQIAIELPPDSVTALGIDPWSFAEGTVSIDGEQLDQIGVRLRGKIGSFRDLSGKQKFKLDFNQFVDNQRFYGLETLSLNNAIVDCSYLKETLAFRVFSAMGVPSMRTAYAEVSVNGSPYGLYVIMEVPDDRFLRRHYENPDGNLYDGKYVWYGGYSYTLLDFATGVDTMYQLEEGTDVTHADITAVSTALSESAGTADFYDRMGEVIDWDLFHREQLSEQWVGQNDGYGMNKNNYRVYFNPSTGRMEIIPWDMDYAFLYDYTWGRSWASPYGNIAYYCMQDSTCRQRQRELAGELLEVVAEMELAKEAQRLANLTESAIMADPRRECSWDSVQSYRNEVFSWLNRRSGELQTFWELP